MCTQIFFRLAIFTKVVSKTVRRYPTCRCRRRRRRPHRHSSRNALGLFTVFPTPPPSLRSPNRPSSACMVHPATRQPTQPDSCLFSSSPAKRGGNQGIENQRNRKRKKKKKEKKKPPPTPPQKRRREERRESPRELLNGMNQDGNRMKKRKGQKETPPRAPSTDCI